MNSKHEIPEDLKALEKTCVQQMTYDMPPEMSGIRAEIVHELIERIASLEAALKVAENRHVAFMVQGGPVVMKAEYDSLQSQLTEARSQIEGLKRELADEEQEHERTIIQRDAAEETLSNAYLGVTGCEAVWSNLFGYDEALNGIVAEKNRLEAQLASVGKGVTEQEWMNQIGTGISFLLPWELASKVIAARITQAKQG